MRSHLGKYIHTSYLCAVWGKDSLLLHVCVHEERVTHLGSHRVLRSDYLREWLLYSVWDKEASGQRALLKCCPTFCINTGIIFIHKVRFVSSAPLGNNYNAVCIVGSLHLTRTRRRLTFDGTVPTHSPFYGSCCGESPLLVSFKCLITILGTQHNVLRMYYKRFLIRSQF